MFPSIQIVKIGIRSLPPGADWLTNCSWGYSTRGAPPKTEDERSEAKIKRVLHHESFVAGPLRLYIVISLGFYKSIKNG